MKLEYKCDHIYCTRQGEIPFLDFENAKLPDDNLILNIFDHREITRWFCRIHALELCTPKPFISTWLTIKS